ncbi:MAG: isocitrate/isopropylmalate dehydrogenase family protein [Deltaproteobacteria bacterium]|nr:isocitrate/isopropylmalate dehydrogenase family protein [Deltaproteobacteria bacterium]
MVQFPAMGIEITYVPGEGLGPELLFHARRVIDALLPGTRWDEQEMGRTAFERTGEAVPRTLVESIRRTRVAIKGPVESAMGVKYSSPNVQLRKTLNLYANVRPLKSLPHVREAFRGIDAVIIRENTEDIYAGIEHKVAQGVVLTIKLATRIACERISHFAFEYAKRYGRRSITCVHKANIMKKSDGLFLETARRVAGESPFIGFSDFIVDNASLQMVQRPQKYDLILTTNLYGDLLSDLGAGLVGGPGTVASASYGDGGMAVFELFHGARPHRDGRDWANPTGILRTVVMLLEHINEREKAQRLDAAIDSIVTGGRDVTGDMGGSATTTRMVDAVLAKAA